MAQASVLTDTEIRRVFRIIATTRHAKRNRLAFVLSFTEVCELAKSPRSLLATLRPRMVTFAVRSNSALIKRKDRKVEQSFCQRGFLRRSGHTSRIAP